MAWKNSHVVAAKPNLTHKFHSKKTSSRKKTEKSGSFEIDSFRFCSDAIRMIQSLWTRREYWSHIQYCKIAICSVFFSPKSRNINWELGEFLRSEHFWVLLENSGYLSPSVSGTICFLCLTHPSYWTSYGQLSRTQKPFNCFSFIITASPSISPFHIFQSFFFFETQPWHLPFS